MKWSNYVLNKETMLINCKNKTILSKNENNADIKILDGLLAIHYAIIKDGQNKNSHLL